MFDAPWSMDPAKLGPLATSCRAASSTTPSLTAGTTSGSGAAQATHVFAYVCERPVRDGEPPRPAACIRNASQQPVYDVSVFWGGSPAGSLPFLLPGDEGVIRGAGSSVADGTVPMRIEFATLPAPAGRQQAAANSPDWSAHTPTSQMIAGPRSPANRGSRTRLLDHLRRYPASSPPERRPGRRSSPSLSTMARSARGTASRIPAANSNTTTAGYATPKRLALSAPPGRSLSSTPSGAPTTYSGPLWNSSRQARQTDGSTSRIRAWAVSRRHWRRVATGSHGSGRSRRSRRGGTSMTPTA
jgi:hypothetical protein